MDSRPIGIFDSGVGGLTALTALKAILPDENIIYFGDTGRCPYGGKTIEELRIIANDNLAFLKSFGVKAILAACGTVSANCEDILNSAGVKVINVLRPALAEMEKQEGKLAVIATEASVRSGAWTIPGRETVAVGCPDFVPLIESGHISPDDGELKAAVAKYLAEAENAGALLLGCTHYGLIRQAVSDYLGEDTVILSASECAAKAMAAYLIENNLTGGEGKTEYYTSGDVEVFNNLAGRIVNASGCNYQHALRAGI